MLSYLSGLQSPIVYQQYAGIQKELFELAQLYYQPQIIVHHYRGSQKPLVDIILKRVMQVKR